MSLDYPRLRHLDTFPYEENGQTYVVLRDPTRISERLLAVAPELLELLPLLNGRNSLRDIQVELSRRFGRIFFMEDLNEIVGQLDEARFLLTDGFEEHYRQVVSEFRRAAVRPPSHAGTAYPAEPTELLTIVSDFYLHPDGAGLPKARTKRSIRAVVAPHIDLRSGGPTYTHAYRALAESSSPDLFVILGTGHYRLPEMFSISGKDFATPLALSPSDRDFLNVLEGQFPGSLFGEDFTHHTEHTIEFQLVFLHHLFRNPPPRVLAILCSFSYRDVLPGNSLEAQRFRQFVDGFRRAEETAGRKICFIVSVDFAHIGPRYGDSFSPSPTVVEQTMQKDREMIRHLTLADSTQFLEFIASEQDSRRICGFPALYTLLHLLDGEKGELLSHRHSAVDAHGSFVSYASMVFDR
jgi:MEMO1 family protein